MITMESRIFIVFKMVGRREILYWEVVVKKQEDQHHKYDYRPSRHSRNSLRRDNQ